MTPAQIPAAYAAGTATAAERAATPPRSAADPDLEHGPVCDDICRPWCTAPAASLWVAS